MGRRPAGPRAFYFRPLAGPPGHVLPGRLPGRAAGPGRRPLAGRHFIFAIYFICWPGPAVFRRHFRYCFRHFTPPILFSLGSARIIWHLPGRQVYFIRRRVAAKLNFASIFAAIFGRIFPGRAAAGRRASPGAVGFATGLYLPLAIFRLFCRLSLACRDYFILFRFRVY